MPRKRSIWDRYLEAVRRQAEGAGADPAPAISEKERTAGRRGGGRVLSALRSLAGLGEFAVWLGTNLVILLVIVLAAQAAGAKLPPWLAELAAAIQGLFDKIATLIK